MRRPSIACRRAVQSLNPSPPPHVWVSDDLLALAVRRFLRASCPHQRRHGSHVPGPLEASRRANKRRMAVQAGVHPPGGMLPPLFDFAALFGVRRSGEPSWRYEPPAPKPVEPLNLSFDSVVPPPETYPPPAVPCPSAIQAIPDGFFSPVDTHLCSDNALEHNSSAALNKLSSMGSAERRAYVKSCFGKFVHELFEAESLSGDERLRAVLEAYQNHCPKVPDAGRYSMLVYSLMFQRKAAGWTHQHILACLNAPCARLPHVYTEGGLRMLRKMEGMSDAPLDCIPALHQLYRKCASQAADGICNRGPAHQDAALCHLIRGLWGTSSIHLTPNLSQPLDGCASVHTAHLLRALSMRLSDTRLRDRLCAMFLQPRHVSDHIASLISCCTRNPDLKPLGVKVLELIPRRLLDAWKTRLYLRLAESKENTFGSRSGLAIWLSMLRMLDGKAANLSGSDSASHSLASFFREHHSSGTPPRAVVATLVYTLASHKSIAGADSDRLMSMITSHRSFLRQQSETNISREELLARLMSKLYKESIPNHGVLELVLPLPLPDLDTGPNSTRRWSDYLSAMLDLNADLISMLDVLTRLRSNGTRLSHSQHLIDYIAQLIKEIQQENEWNELAEAYTTLVLQTCRHIQRLLTELGTRNYVRLSRRARRFGHILQQAQEAHIVPLACDSMMNNLPLSAQTELLHQFAHQYSLDRTRTHLQNWRSIYALYSYLRRYRLKITPLFTKAVLCVCITQPLSENQFVSARRLVWVCGLVAEVEGVEAARQIEHMFWVWRGNVIRHAKSTSDMAGGQGRVHISRMKRLGMI